MTPEDVLEFWFGDWSDDAELDDASDPQLRRWWSKDDEVDRVIRERFADVHQALTSGAAEDWAQTPRGLLASVIVLDQFSRVIHRGTAEAFAQDSRAQALTAKALARAWDRELRPIERSFLYIPLMHAEDRAAHRKALLLYTSLAEEVEEAGLARADYYRGTVRYEIEHKEIIDRFGRYPHRNHPLERTCTPEELAFLRDDGATF